MEDLNIQCSYAMHYKKYKIKLWIKKHLTFVLKLLFTAKYIFKLEQGHMYWTHITTANTLLPIIAHAQ